MGGGRGTGGRGQGGRKIPRRNPDAPTTVIDKECLGIMFWLRSRLPRKRRKIHILIEIQWIECPSWQRREAGARAAPLNLRSSRLNSFLDRIPIIASTTRAPCQSAVCSCSIRFDWTTEDEWDFSTTEKLIWWPEYQWPGANGQGELCLTFRGKNRDRAVSIIRDDWYRINRG